MPAFTGISTRIIVTHRLIIEGEIWETLCAVNVCTRLQISSSRKRGHTTIQCSPELIRSIPAVKETRPPPCDESGWNFIKRPRVISQEYINHEIYRNYRTINQVVRHVVTRISLRVQKLKKIFEELKYIFIHFTYSEKKVW